jgi:hypothetical protein
MYSFFQWFLMAFLGSQCFRYFPVLSLRRQNRALVVSGSGFMARKIGGFYAFGFVTGALNDLHL